MSPAAALLGLLLPAALKATLLLVLAAAVDRTVLHRRSSAAARHLLWSYALIGALLIPAFAWALPGWGLNLPGGPSAMLQREPAAAAPTAVRPSLPQPTVSDPPPAPQELAGSAAAEHAERTLANGSRPRREASAGRVQWTDVLVAVYLAGALLLLAKVAAEQLVVRRFARGARPALGAEWNTLLRSVAAALGVRRQVVLLQSHASSVPLTGGVLRPFILIPAAADEWPRARRQAVLLHEMAHVARHDCLTQALAALTCAVYWPHPGVWWAARRLRVEQELACDDQVLACGVPAHDYAGHLLAIARERPAARPLTALAMYMAAPSQLEVRIRAAIDRGRARTVPGPHAAVLSAVLTTALLLPLSAIRAAGPHEGPHAERGEPVAGASGAVQPADGSQQMSPVAPVLRAPSDSAAAMAAELSADTGTTADTSSAVLLGGTWALRLAGSDEAGETRAAHPVTPIVHVALQAPGLNTLYIPLTSLEGLTLEEIASSAAVRFRLRKDAGTFNFEGAFQAGRGSGRFDFAPDSSFAEALVRRGMSRPTPEQHLSLARHDVDLDFLDELTAHGYAQPSTEALVRVGLTGVDLRYVRDMAELGYRLGTVQELVGLSNHSIGPTLIRELAALGYRGLSPADLLRMRRSGVGIDFIRRMNERAGGQLTPAELVDLRNRGAGRASPDGPVAAAVVTPQEAP